MTMISGSLCSKSSVFLFSQQQKYNTTTRIRRMVEHKESINNLTNVSLNITKHLFSKKEYQNMNVVFSPLSLHVMLSILAAGSEGLTQRQLLSFLRSKSTNHLNSLAPYLVFDVLCDGASVGGPNLSVANGVWVEQTLSLQPSFEQLVVADYKATAALVDFKNKADEATKEVNLWAEKETNGLIKNLVSRGLFNRITRLVIANALYFKGAWYEEFAASKTKDYDFHLLKGNSIKVPFMTSKRDQFISAFDGFKVLCLPYSNDEDMHRQFSMYFFLPDAKDGLSALIEKVANEPGFLEHALPLEKVKVGDFRIPRFNISFGLEISNVLTEMGLVLPSISGDLTKMVVVDSEEDLQVSGIIQKSTIEVNEGGTVAAAASVFMAAGSSWHTPTPTRMDFVADHPFLFLIREDLSRTVLFVGQVQNPAASMDD